MRSIAVSNIEVVEFVMLKIVEVYAEIFAKVYAEMYAEMYAEVCAGIYAGMFGSDEESPCCML